MDEPTFSNAVDLREYLAVLRARKWSIFLVTAIVVGSALFFSYRQTPLYAATTRLLVKGVPTDSSGFVALPNLQTEAEILNSEPVALRVISDLDLDIAPRALIDGVEVEPAAETAQVLALSYTSPDPALARDIPNSFAANYISHKEEQAREAIELGREALENQITAVQNNLNAVTREIDEIGNDEVLAATLENERSTLIARLGVLQQRLDDYQARQPLNLAGGEIIEPASLPGSPSSPDHVRNGLLALFLGVVLGVGLAFLRERLDDRLRGRDDLERALQVPVLVTVPKFPSTSKTGDEIVTISQPKGSASEAYRSLRTNLQFLSVQRELRSVLITSPSAGEGKTATAVNLAVAFAQAGKRVVLVSADLRRPTLDRYFGIPNQEGLTTWLMAADRELWGLIRDPGIDNLRIVPCGPIPPNPAELLSSTRVTELIDLLEANADLVLIDSPPALAVADAAILATHVDGTLLVVDAHGTNRSAASRAAEELQRVGAGLLGSVLNSFDPSASPYYQQAYYSSHYYSSDPSPHQVDVGEARAARKSRISFRK